MKNVLILSGILSLACLSPQRALAWNSYLDGSSLPDANGWILDGDAGSVVSLGGGNSGFQQVDSSATGYDEWYVVNTNRISTLAARFRIDSYAGGPLNLLQLAAANSGASASPAMTVGIRDGRLYLIRFVADNTGAAVEDARVADLGALRTGVFNDAYLSVDSNTGRVRLFWNGGLRYSGVETNAAFMWTGEAYAEFGASNFLPEADRSGTSSVTFDWVGLGDASDLPLPLPFIPWTQYLDGGTVPASPWQGFTDGDSGTTSVFDFNDPANGSANQAIQLNSGSGANEWYVGPFFEDEVLGAARFTVQSFSATGKENLLCVTTTSEPMAPAPAITLVNGRYKLWNYVEANTEIMDIGPVVAGEWHTAYLYARKDGRVKLWWDGNLIYDDVAPLVNPYSGYFEWGSGSWQFDATDTLAFDWVAFGLFSAQPTLTTSPANGDIFQNPGAGFSFTNVSGDGVGSDGVSIVVNGVDQTTDLVISGTDNIRQGSIGGLLSNQLYEVVLTFTELDGDVFTYKIKFDTFSPSNLTIEAEDWNFLGGQFVDNPLLSADPFYADTYFGKPSYAEIDFHDPDSLPGASHLYRSSDPVGTEVAGDILRQKFIDAQVSDPNVADYDVGWVEIGEWLNYTHTFPAGNYNIYGRLAYGVIGDSFTASVDKVQNSTAQEQSTTPLGVFLGGPGRGWQSYDFVPLTDAQGNLKTVTLDGVETLRVTATAGGYNANFYIFIPSQRPVLNIARANGNAVISWIGQGFVLQSAPSPDGPWTPVSNQTNPYNAPLTGAPKFFRLVQ